MTDITLPQIDQATVQSPDRPLSPEEVAKAISALQTNKSPGPDGFPVEFYKAFSAELVPMLFNMYNESFESGSLPKTLREASITLLLKKNKDPQSCGSKHKHRFSFFNIRRLFNIIYHPSQSTTPEVVVSLDAEKAFDRVERRCLVLDISSYLGSSCCI